MENSLDAVAARTDLALIAMALVLRHRRDENLLLAVSASAARWKEHCTSGGASPDYLQALSEALGDLLRAAQPEQ